MPEGTIIGGWSYVIAAYAITGGGLLVYLLSLGRREKHLDNED